MICASVIDVIYTYYFWTPTWKEIYACDEERNWIESNSLQTSSEKIFWLKATYEYNQTLKLDIGNTMHHSLHVMFPVSCLKSIWSHPSRLFLPTNNEWKQLVSIALFNRKTSQFYCSGFACLMNLHRTSPYDDIRLFLITSSWCILFYLRIFFCSVQYLKLQAE